MKIFRTKPEESTQWQSDSPSVKAMRLILPIAAMLSAVSLAGGLASFLELQLSNHLHLILAVFFALAAFFFDGLGISSGRSVVRDFILSARGEIERGYLFWVSLSLAAVIAGSVVLGSFRASRNGIKYLVLEAKKAQEWRTETDTTLTATVEVATDQNAAILEAKKEAYEAEKMAVIATYSGKIEAVNVDIAKRRRQRSEENKEWIDNKISALEKSRAQLEAAKGKELAALAGAFAEEQTRLLATAESLQTVTVDDAKAASERRKIKQAAKDQADAQLSNLVSGIFSWSIVLMLVIGIRLEILETRNGILPNPILSNTDLSGLEEARRFVLAFPYFVFSWINWGAEKLYHLAAKKPVPIVDNDLVNYKTAQQETEAIRKEAKIRVLPKPTTRRKIGFNQNHEVESDQNREKPPKFHAPFNLHENPTNGTLEPRTEQESKSPDNTARIRQLKKDLNKYKKRYARHVQKKLNLERKGQNVPQRTLDAIANNWNWVEHYQKQLSEIGNDDA